MMRAGGSACNLFSRPSPSPNWYVDDSDDFGQNQNFSPKSIPTHLPAAPQMSVSAAPQTPSTHHPSTPQMSVSAAPQTPRTHHLSTAPQMSASVAPVAQGSLHPPTVAPQTATMSQPAAITSARATGEKKVLDSACINKSQLLPVDVVVAKYPKLRTVTKASTLAVKLAKESVFGEDVMRQCTVFGTRQLPGLPREELFQLKKAVFDQFPQFWSHPPQFESVWKDCIASVNQSSKSLRANNPLQLTTHAQ